jgi:hypothetical protein
MSDKKDIISSTNIKKIKFYLVFNKIIILYRNLLKTLNFFITLKINLFPLLITLISF